MSSLFLGLLLFLSGAPKTGVDERVELLSIVYRLAGAPEYSGGSIPKYNEAIDRHFAPFRNHQVVQLAKQYRKEDGVSYDAVMSLAVRLNAAYHIEGANLDSRWKPAKVERFLVALRQFTQDAQFREFTASQEALFETANRRLTTMVQRNLDLDWFDRFFGTSAPIRVFVVPGMTNGGSSYGASRVANDGVEEIYAIPGTSRIDEQGLPVFPLEGLGTLVHEVTHSYSNPVVDRHWTGLSASAAQMNAPLREQMRRQAYGTPKTLIYETLVRAVTALYATEHSGAEAGKRSADEERARGFLWTNELAGLLEEYAAQRNIYSTLDSFMPRLRTYFDSLGPRVPAMVTAYENERPQVITMTPPDGSQNVAPDLSEIVVVFDRAMRRDRYAVTSLPGVNSPKFGKPGYDETGKVFLLPVSLEAGKEYGFGLNWEGGGSFVSEKGGAPLSYRRYRFKTKEHTPEEVVARFYRKRIELGLSGAPSSEQLQGLQPYLSKGLFDLLAEANRFREKERQEAPDEKPSFADGDLFTSLFEGPVDFRTEQATTEGNTRVVPVQFSFSTAPQQVVWKDFCVVIRENERWVLDDVRFSGKWAFANRGTLKKSLQASLHPDKK